MTALLFDLPEINLRRPSEPIIRAAEIERRYRWTLSRRWASGPLCAWCGCNPSNANGQSDDPTLWRMMGFAWRWGYGGIVVVNVLPFIAAKMTELRAWRASDAPYVDIARGENIGHVARVLALADLAVACWGNLPDPKDVALLAEGVTLTLGSEVDWHCIGTTNDGAPKHPMARGKHRVPDDAKPQRWRLAA